MPTAKLTKKLLDQQKPGERETIYWDTEVVGLGFKVLPATRKSPSGRRVFILVYRTADGTQRKPTLGSYGALTLDQARRIARDMLAEVRAGRDPSLERQEARVAPTMSMLCDRYLAEHAEPHKKPSSVYSDKLLIKKYILPSLGKKRVPAVTNQDVEKLHRQIGEEKPVAANRVVSLLSMMFTLAERWDLRPRHSNPCQDVKRFKETSKHRPLNDEELGQLINALEEEEEKGECSGPALAAIRLIMFTGMRRNEALNLQWSEVDLDRGILRLRDSKTGPKTVWLSSAARELIASQKAVEGNPYVFPGRGTGSPLRRIQKAWERIRHLAGLAKDVRLHDLRHNYAAAAAASGLSLPQIGQLLGHRKPATTARYSSLVDEAMQRNAQLVGDAITKKK